VCKAGLGVRPFSISAVIAAQEIRMKNKTRRNAKAVSNRETPLITVGEILANDTVVELVGVSSNGKLNLLVWNGARGTVASHMSCQ